MKYKSTFGRWKVTTEGDCEGRSNSDLGVWDGHVDEIALHLADKQYYGLSFRLIEPQPEIINPVRNEVNIQLDIDSGTWDYRGDELVREMKNFFKDRPVDVEDCNYFSSVTIKPHQPLSPEQIAKRKAIKHLKSKMSQEDLDILGLGDLK